MQDEYIKASTDALAIEARKSHDDVISFARRTEIGCPTPPPKSAIKKFTDSIFQIESTVPVIKDQFGRMGNRARAGKRYLKHFKIPRGLRRRAHTPSIENFLMKFFAFWIGESLLGGYVYSLGGAFSLPAGIGYSATFGVANLSLALAIGWTLRWALITYHDNYKVAKVKAFAWSVIGVFSTLLGLLIWSASRLRSLARNSDLFNLQELGIIATYTDAYTLIFLAIAIVATAFGIYEGFHHVSDPVPGFKEVQCEADAIDERGEDAAESWRFLIEDNCENAIADLEDSEPTPDEIDRYREDVEDVLSDAQESNSLVAQNASDINALNQQRFDIDGGTPPKHITLAELIIDVDALQEKLSYTPHQNISEDLIGRIESAKEAALNTVTECLMAYLEDNKPYNDFDNEPEN